MVCVTFCMLMFLAFVCPVVLAMSGDWKHEHFKEIPMLRFLDPSTADLRLLFLSLLFPWRLLWMFPLTWKAVCTPIHHITLLPIHHGGHWTFKKWMSLKIVPTKPKKHTAKRYNKKGELELIPVIMMRLKDLIESIIWLDSWLAKDHANFT